MNPDHRPYTPEERAHIKRRHAEDVPYILIAHELDRTPGSIGQQVAKMRNRHEITHLRGRLGGRKWAGGAELPAACAIAPLASGFDPGMVRFLVAMIGLCVEHACATCECWRAMALAWLAARECRGVGAWA